MSNYSLSARGMHEGRYTNKKGLAKLLGVVFAVVLACGIVPAIAFAAPVGLTSAQGDQFVYTLNADSQAGVTQDGSNVIIDVATAGDTSTVTIDVAYPANTYMVGMAQIALKDSQGGALTAGTTIAGSNYTENAGGLTLVQPITSTAGDMVTFEADGDITAGTAIAAQTTLHKATISLPKATAGTVVNVVVGKATSATNGEGNEIWAVANAYTVATITYVDSSVESPIFSVYKQLVDDSGTAVGDKVLVKTYTKSELKAIATTQDATTGTVGWEVVKQPQGQVRVYGATEYVTYENLFNNAGISSLWKSGSFISFADTSGPYTKATHSYDDATAGKFYPVVGSDEGAYSVPGALMLSYKYYVAGDYDNASAALAAALTDAYANDQPTAIISSSTSVAENMLQPKNVPYGLVEITLNYQEAPVLTIYKQEANDAEPTLVKSYTKSELQAIATTQTAETVNPAAWAVVKNNNARVYTASEYVSFTNLFADASLTSQWVDGSYLTFTCNDGPYSKAQYTYADVKAGKFYPDMAEASSGYAVDGAVLINWGNKYANEYDNASAAQVAALTAAYDGGNLACALGSASNVVEELHGNNYIPSGVVAITLHYTTYTANVTTADTTLKVGDTFTVDVNMMGQAYAAAQGSLSYDTTALRLVSITQGAGLAGEGLSFETEGDAFSFYGNTADTTAGAVVATYTFECIAVTSDTNIVLTFDAAGKAGSFEDITVTVAEKVSKQVINNGLVIGDLNNNTKINIVDAQICYDLATAVYGTAFENFPLFDGWTVADLTYVADANGDKTVDATDARAIQHYGLFGAWE